ncbi:carboxymethylenebutenolidase [Altererythrobacter atlanticus]|uniref:Dienelactone hydrolase family protein n=1 Tax=Croceibacterium atlanticum TaxID=1267766 RepID=A0A0F7KUV1_9SPHN|nr:dienelactone hydrolase family protein [Croceibacterium atlanticum]AKH42951.1 Dienelactone hydrolase family protein [Croceibacterium atlanticum]MBB5734092.1 carboxymethylenebutenolidase [Croceibacterium atlanticum]
MCDEQQLARMGRLNRRQFTAFGAIAGLAACAPMNGAKAEGSLSEEMVSFSTPLGTMDAFFVHPAEGAYPAVIVWPDIAGLRDAFKMMARRLAGEGYSVLVLNPYYQSAPAPQFEDFEDWRNNDGMAKVGPWREENTHEAVTETAKAAVAWLDGQEAVDTSRGIGTQGYCMGGPFVVRTAAAVPSRVKAGASFHGGGLVGDDDTAPINLLDDTQASFLIAIAQNDDARVPGEKDALRAAAEAAGRPAEIEVYAGDHGWTVVDSPVYAEEPAEKAWSRLLALYESAL